jgi:hypothetical protein
MALGTADPDAAPRGPAIVVADLADGLALRARGLPVLATWLPPVRDDLLAVDGTPAAWRRRRPIVQLVDGTPSEAPVPQLALAADLDTLRPAFAAAQAVALPMRPRDPRLAAARALLAMACGCLVLGAPPALDYGALEGEHFLRCPVGGRHQRRLAEDPALAVVRENGRELAARHAAAPRLQRLLAGIVGGDRGRTDPMLGARPPRRDHERPS